MYYLVSASGTLFVFLIGIKLFIHLYLDWATGEKIKITPAYSLKYYSFYKKRSRRQAL